MRMYGSSRIASWRSGSVTKYGERYPLSNCMPSVSSSSMPKVFDSSTVTVPSLPTLSMASAMTSPMAASAAEIVATCAIWVLPETSWLWSAMDSTAALTAFSMPRFRPEGLAPAATLRRPSLMRACASTVAVVVPSPATSLVFVATSFTSCAPMFSNGSSSSISRAIDTPSLVMVGAPNFLPRTTLRPLGPSVTLTASANLSTPASRPRRASSSNFNNFDICLLSYSEGVTSRARQGLLGYGREDVTAGEDQKVLTVNGDLGAAVLRVDDGVANRDASGDDLAGGVGTTTGTRGEHFALLGLLFGGVGNHQARSRGGLSAVGTNDDAVF